MLERLRNACLVRPEDIAPSRQDFEVVGAFNPGAIATGRGDEVVLLVRVAERPKEKRAGFTPLPRWDVETDEIVVDWLPDSELECIDPRVVELKEDGRTRLTFVSHLQVVRSPDGVSVESFEGARFDPGMAYEVFGVEDPRITRIGGRVYFTYVAVSPHGAATALASTSDFEHFERHGIIFPPENKDVVIFPEKIGGEYVALHRPSPATHFTQPEMWLARSTDLTHWGGHEPFRSGGSDWESGRTGGGCPPIRVDGGWLEIYHGNERPDQPGQVGAYCAGGLLLGGDDPVRIAAKAPEAFLVPEAEFEREGFVPDVVFPTGVIARGDRLLVYYGAADAHCAVVEWSLEDVMEALGR
jgi:predicted GH43/DUF377 family glycosyl hydrolase